MNQKQLDIINLAMLGYDPRDEAERAYLLGKFRDTVAFMLGKSK